MLVGEHGWAKAQWAELVENVQGGEKIKKMQFRTMIQGALNQPGSESTSNVKSLSDFKSTMLKFRID